MKGIGIIFAEQVDKIFHRVVEDEASDHHVADKVATSCTKYPDFGFVG